MGLIFVFGFGFLEGSFAFRQRVLRRITALDIIDSMNASLGDNIVMQLIFI